MTNTTNTTAAPAFGKRAAIAATPVRPRYRLSKAKLAVALLVVALWAGIIQFGRLVVWPFIAQAFGL